MILKPPNMIKLLIADNHPIVRKGLELLFSSSSNIQIMASVDNGEAVIDFIKKVPVDIILTEIDLPKLNGLTTGRSLCHQCDQGRSIRLHFKNS